MNLKTRIVKLEKSVKPTPEIVLIGWQGADFYPVTEEEKREAAETGRLIFWRE